MLLQKTYEMECAVAGALPASFRVCIYLSCQPRGRPAQERLGVLLEKADEMECAVAGCNFLLRAILHEAFSFEAGQAHFEASNGAPALRPAPRGPRAPAARPCARAAQPACPRRAACAATRRQRMVQGCTEVQRPNLPYHTLRMAYPNPGARSGLRPVPVPAGQHRQRREHAQGERRGPVRARVRLQPGRRHLLGPLPPAHQVPRLRRDAGAQHARRQRQGAPRPPRRAARLFVAAWASAAGLPCGGQQDGMRQRRCRWQWCAAHLSDQLVAGTVCTCLCFGPMSQRCKPLGGNTAVRTGLNEGTVLFYAVKASALLTVSHDQQPVFYAPAQLFSRRRAAGRHARGRHLRRARLHVHRPVRQHHRLVLWQGMEPPRQGLSQRSQRAASCLAQSHGLSWPCTCAVLRCRVHQGEVGL